MINRTGSLLYFIRHATPDLSRKDIPYDIPPGPPLAPRGEQDTVELAAFLKDRGVIRLYSSPFERAARTAAIVSAINGIPLVEDERLKEWRWADEREERVKERMLDIFEYAVNESLDQGPIGLVSHGGPIAVLLQGLGIDEKELVVYRKKFDTTNPLPPAGAWQAQWDERQQAWNLKLVFTPSLNDL